MMINGTNYSLPFIAIASFLVLFAIQFLLLQLNRMRFLRHLPWIWVIGMAFLSVSAMFAKPGGFIDLRSFFTLVIAGYAAVCTAGIALAHFLYKLQNR